ALACGADRIMLDNMNDELMRQAVGIVGGQAETEASGNMNLDRLLALADSGLDFVSFGELTHSVAVFDFSLKEERTV
ncbi:MAG TPA: nicotinate-nucleotide diphosphorylase (carboxylating), partial [Spirochaetales bacterium]|nr:nicotinate-nucleotide diphosphorylase (carboxylating) [Spirochaetales bacterium]